MNFLEATKFTDRDLIEGILRSFYIVDYGYILKLNPTGTVNIAHAKLLQDLDGNDLGQTVTENVEMLTLSGAGFSIKWDYKAGDKVLLLGLKDFVKNVNDVNKSTKKTVLSSYSRTTLKAFPLCVFNDESKVKFECESGNLKINTEGNIELNGNKKNLVTWKELDTALQDVWSAIKGHTHDVTGSCVVGEATIPVTGTASASSSFIATSLDISAAKAETLFTD